MNDLADIIIELYKEYNVPSDTIVDDEEHLQAFYKLVCDRIESPVKPTITQMRKRLIGLRKKGNDTLPRLRHKYNGRYLNKARA